MIEFWNETYSVWITFIDCQALDFSVVISHITRSSKGLHNTEKSHISHVQYLDKDLAKQRSVGVFFFSTLLCLYFGMNEINKLIMQCLCLKLSLYFVCFLE